MENSTNIADLGHSWAFFASVRPIGPGHLRGCHPRAGYPKLRARKHCCRDRRVHPKILTSEKFVIVAAIAYIAVCSHLPNFLEEVDYLKDYDAYLRACINYDYSKEGSRSDYYCNFIRDYSLNQARTLYLCLMLKD
jgi:hypothetical protein